MLLFLSTYFILLIHFSLCFYDNVNFTINVNVISLSFYGIIFHCWSTPISTQLALHNHFIIVSSDGDGVLSPHTDTIMIPLLTDYVTAIQKPVRNVFYSHSHYHLGAFENEHYNNCLVYFYCKLYFVFHLPNSFN